MPVPAIWGPKLWATLHAIGARAGKNSKSLRIDEAREIKWLLEHLETIVPCPECRQHIKTYRQTTGLPENTYNTGEWLSKFHNAVNVRLGKNEVPYTNELGSSTTILSAWSAYQDVLKESMFRGTVRGEAIKEWNRHLRMWMGFCGC
jgi:hypothetical protein